MTGRRRVFIQVEEWKETPFTDLRKGDVFKLVDEPETAEGETLSSGPYTASSAPYKNEDGFLEIEADK